MRDGYSAGDTNAEKPVKAPKKDPSDLLSELISGQSMDTIASAALQLLSLLSAAAVGKLAQAEAATSETSLDDESAAVQVLVKSMFRNVLIASGAEVDEEPVTREDIRREILEKAGAVSAQVQQVLFRKG
jgi:hypothetical protein